MTAFLPETAEVVSGDWLFWLFFPLLGALSGILAGLFGIGGGLVIVPALNLFFVMTGDVIPADSRMHFAIGSSLAVIVFTALSSLRSHHKRGGVVWGAVRRLVPGVLAGGLIGAALADSMSNRLLQSTFGVFVVLIALYIVLGYRPSASRNLPAMPGFVAAGVVIGVVSALAGIGGGVMTVPFMLWCATPMRSAVGTAAACTFPVALAGTAGFIIMGWEVSSGLPGSTGYVYWPAVAGIAVASVFLAPVGAFLAHTLPVERLRQAFAVLLVFVGVRMLF